MTLNPTNHAEDSSRNPLEDVKYTLNTFEIVADKLLGEGAYNSFDINGETCSISRNQEGGYMLTLSTKGAEGTFETLRIISELVTYEPNLPEEESTDAYQSEAEYNEEFDDQPDDQIELKHEGLEATLFIQFLDRQGTFNAIRYYLENELIVFTKNGQRADHKFKDYEDLDYAGELTRVLDTIQEVLVALENYADTKPKVE